MAAVDKNIEIQFQGMFPTFEVNEASLITVNLIKSDNSVTDISNYTNTHIFSLDAENIYFNADDNMAIFKKEGSGKIKAIYKNAKGQTFTAEKEFIVYERWFADNYLNYLTSSFDKYLLENNTLAKVIMDTCMEMMDVFYAYVKDIDVIDNFKGGKSKFLSLVAQNTGFERIDFESVDTTDEEKSNEAFRELLSNILDLLGIRGSILSYELFFGALGYNVDIEEFWWDNNGSLIEIDPINNNDSSYYAYRTDGTNIDDPPIPRNDPRRFASPLNSVTVNSKSNYVRPILSVKDADIAPAPASFTSSKRVIINKYLEYLRPSHIQYMDELVVANLGSDMINLAADENFFYSNLLEYDINGGEGFGGGPGDVYPIHQFMDQFIRGTLKDVSDELSYVLKWDAGNFWDSGINWDQKKFLSEFFSFTEL